MSLSELYSNSTSVSDFCESYFEYFSSKLRDAKLIQSCSDVLNTLTTISGDGGRIYFCGNGGSASTANHFAADIGNNTRSDGYPAMITESLCSNEALVTAIGNDYGYSKLFVRQLEDKLSSRDCVVAISASGNSPNVLEAISFAKELGATTIGLTGFDGGKLRDLADINFHAPFEKGEYGPVEDYHLMLNHFIVSTLRLQRLGHP
jgi:D-sedoheptulose 7-phosphate isomerase